ncbi:MAG: hypothetical protein GX649_10140 [Chloroflexi bacterium]|nr:hypothetical protein [Chloroflexota bacterium]
MTTIAIRGTQWLIDGAVAYAGAPAEGLLMNVRMVNATFEDLARDDWDPEANTDAFIAHLPDYVAHGVRAFTLNLQGGTPGYEGAVNSAYRPDGTLHAEYLARVRRAIEACDAAGAAVILGLYYQRQSGILEDEDAVRAGVVHASEWVAEEGFGNVALEIANEFGHPGFRHGILKDPDGQAELIGLAKQTAPGMLVSTSGLGHGRLPAAVAEAADFLLIHYNETPLVEIPDRIAALRGYDKPIVCNEDVKEGEEGARAAETSVREGASWGLMLERVNQHFPFSFRGHLDDPIVYERLRALTTA